MNGIFWLATLLNTEEDIDKYVTSSTYINQSVLQVNLFIYLIGLFALDFYRVKVDSSYALIK